MTHREQLITEIERFCEAKGLTERELSRLAVPSPKFVNRLRAGAVTLKLIEAVEQFMLLHQHTPASELFARLSEMRLASRPAAPAQHEAA